MVIFNKWNPYKVHEDKTEFDTIQEANEEVNLIEEMYADTPRPKYKYHDEESWKWKVWRQHHRPQNYDYIWSKYDIGESFWGYAILDFEKEEIVKWGHDHLHNWTKWSHPLKMKDHFFRGENEIPLNYKWDDGEYDGWLQFRWGDGKNAVGYVQTEEDKQAEKCALSPKKCRKRRFVVKEYNESEEEELDKLNAELMEENKSEEVEHLIVM